MVKTRIRIVFIILLPDHAQYKQLSKQQKHFTNVFHRLLNPQSSLTIKEPKTNDCVSCLC